jgi:hypothetical protein
MSTEGERWPEMPAPRTAGFEGGDSQQTSPPQRGGIRSGAARRGPTRRWSQETAGEAEKPRGPTIRDGELTHTITCSCCDVTVEVPLRRRFLCDSCFHESRG